VRTGLVLLCLLSLPASAYAATDRSVDAGSLEARLATGSFGLVLSDGRAGSLLDRAGVRVRTADGAFRAVRATRVVRRGRGLAALLTTGAPGGRSLRLRMSPVADGVIRVSVAGGPGATALAASFGAAPGELFSGFGERSNAVDFRGRDVLNYVSDGPYREADRALPRSIVPPWGVIDRDDSTYYPVPWLLSSRGYGVLIENDETSRFDVGRAQRGRFTLEADASTLSFLVFAGPRPADALRRFTALTGRQPAAQAPWVYGPWFQTGQPNVIPPEEEAGIIRTLRRADTAVSAMETQMHFLPCGAQRGLDDYERRRTTRAHAAGLAQLAYFNPHLCESYEPVFGEAAAAGLLQRQKGGGPAFTYPTFVGGGGAAGFTVEPIAQFDFSARGTEELYEQLVREAFDQGKDGWMEDFGEFTPPDIASSDGTPAGRIHNRYPRDFHCTVRRIERRLERPVTRHQRSGWTGAARCASIVWGGDPTTVWGYDGLQSAVNQALTIGMSGVARWGSDIGGYNTFNPGQQLSRELLHRWIEFGAVSAVMRTKRSGLAFPSYERPQVFDRESLPVWRRYTKLHTQLYPYLRGADASYRAGGMPIMRHALLTHPGDRRAVRAHGQFMFGPDLLAAPVTTEGARRRRVYTPAGRWVDWLRSVRYRSQDGAFLPARTVLLRGRRVHTLRAAEDELPLLVRAGAVLPMLPADVDTLAPYGRGSVVRLSERAGRLTLLAFPRGRWQGRLGGRGRMRAYEGHSSWSLELRAERPRTYTLRAALGSLRRPFRPRRVTVNGEGLGRAAWRYDPRGEVLTASFSAGRRATLEIR
jgi:alpha-glucosidase (family GH31 glycosyl hydrolase)